MRWKTEEGLQLIKENYLNTELTLEEISKKLGCSQNTIISIATQLNLKLRRGYWTEEETQYLKDNYSKEDMNIEKMSKELGRSIFAIKDRAVLFNIYVHNKYRKSYWLEEEILYVKDNYTSLDMSVKEMAKKLNRSFGAVTYMAGELGLVRDEKEFDEKKICDTYEEGYSKEEVSEILNISRWTVDRVLKENNIFIRGRTKSQRGSMKSSSTMQGISLEDWTGLKTPIAKRFRVFLEYKEWVKKVLERDNYTCQDCGSTENLDVHHIIHVSEILKDVDLSIPLEEIRIYLKENTIMYDESNGEVLCILHHSNRHPEMEGLMLSRLENQEIEYV